MFDYMHEAKVVVVGEKETKAVKFFDYEGKKLFSTFQAYKRVTQLISVELKEPALNGVLIGDKTGEVTFFPLEKARESAEVATKPEGNEEFNAKTVFGHQQGVTYMALNDQKNRLVSLDTMNRVRVAAFPEAYIQT